MPDNREPPADSDACTCAEAADGQTMAHWCPVHGEVFGGEAQLEANNKHWIGCLICGVPLKLGRERGCYLRLFCPQCKNEFVWYPPPVGGEVEGKPPFLVQT